VCVATLGRLAGVPSELHVQFLREQRDSRRIAAINCQGCRAEAADFRFRQQSAGGKFDFDYGGDDAAGLRGPLFIVPRHGILTPKLGYLC